VPFNARYHDSIRTAATDPLIASVMSNISDITSVLLQGGVYYGSRDNRTNLSAAGVAPLSLDGVTSYKTVMFRRPGLATYLLPLDFFVLMDITGTDASLYTFKGFVTNEKLYKTEADLRAAFAAGELGHPYEQTKDQQFALLSLNPEMGVRELEEKFAPASIELGGKRYKFDPEEKYVEYMGWSYYMAHSRTLGLMFYDIKFKGERIIYELSMQEAMAQYAGYTPKSAGTVYHDSYYAL
jgi:primary-amine oxidase